MQRYCSHAPVPTPRHKQPAQRNKWPMALPSRQRRSLSGHRVQVEARGSRETRARWPQVCAVCRWMPLPRTLKRPHTEHQRRSEARDSASVPTTRDPTAMPNLPCGSVQRYNFTLPYDKLLISTLFSKNLFESTSTNVCTCTLSYFRTHS